MIRKKPAAVSQVRKWWNPGWSWKVWAMVAAMLIPTLGFALWVLSQAGGQTRIDPALVGIAGENSGGPVTAITGTEHTVYHSNLPLPDAANPREDGRATLVWFTRTTCAPCEEQLFVHRVMVEFQEVNFAEKEVGREPAAARFAVSNVPLFILLDAAGAELGRFETATDADSFRNTVNELLTAPD